MRVNVDTAPLAHVSTSVRQPTAAFAAQRVVPAAGAKSVRVCYTDAAVVQNADVRNAALLQPAVPDAVEAVAVGENAVRQLMVI